LKSYLDYFFVFALVCAGHVHADELDASWGSAGENLRWSVDSSISVGYGLEDGDKDYEGLIGIDSQKVISTNTRDIGIIIAQIYAVKIHDREMPRPVFLKSESEWAFLPRNIYFDYTGLSQGQFNIRVGHLIPSYGLRLPSNTTGTLRQLIAGPNLGLKIDYGAAVHGEISLGSYFVSATRGSGVEYSSAESPYAFAGRIASPSHNRLVVGLSGLQGKLLTPGGVIKRSRVGLDVQTYLGPVDGRLEVSSGYDPNETEVLNGIVELSHAAGYASTLFYVQGRYFSVKTSADVTWNTRSLGTIGIRHQILQWLTVASNFEYPLSLPDAVDPAPQLRFQLRSRY
jgi:hypothetical protein